MRRFLRQSESETHRRIDFHPCYSDVLFLGFLSAAIVFCLNVEVNARMGGGDSFGSSSSSSSSSSSFSSSDSSFSSTSGSSYGSSSTADPRVLPGMLIGVVVLILIIWLIGLRTDGNWDSSTDSEKAWADYAERNKPLAWLNKTDPNFSQILFEDFVYGLYVRALTARGNSAAMNALKPYLAKPARDGLMERNYRLPKAVSNVVVGAQAISRVTWRENQTVEVQVSFETNYTETFNDSMQKGYYAAENWTFARNVSAKSRPPDKIHAYNCPNCGGAVEGSQDSRCAYCGIFFGSGEFDWFVTTIYLGREEEKGPALTSSVAERGTDNETKVDLQLNRRLSELTKKDPSLTWDGFSARVSMIFETLQTSWSNLSWEAVQPFVTDRFFLSQQGWMDEYRKQGLRNVLKNMHITKIVPVKVVFDPFFDAVTVRIFATGLDYTVEAESKMTVSGSPTEERSFSEYWTFIRSGKRKGAAHADKLCPNCGAAVSIAQTGNCNYCKAKVTGGEFDWVLCRVEQDDTYTG